MPYAGLCTQFRWLWRCASTTYYHHRPSTVSIHYALSFHLYFHQHDNPPIERCTCIFVPDPLPGLRRRLTRRGRWPPEPAHCLNFGRFLFRGRSTLLIVRAPLRVLQAVLSVALALGLVRRVTIVCGGRGVGKGGGALPEERGGQRVYISIVQIFSTKTTLPPSFFNKTYKPSPAPHPNHTPSTLPPTTLRPSSRLCIPLSLCYVHSPQLQPRSRCCPGDH